MPDTWKVSLDGQTVVRTEGRPLEVGHGYTLDYQVDWTAGVTVEYSGVEPAVQRVLHLLPHPDFPDVTVKDVDVLAALEAEDELDAVMPLLLKLDDENRVDLVRKAVVARIHGWPDGGVGALLERVIGIALRPGSDEPGGGHG